MVYTEEKPIYLFIRKVNQFFLNIKFYPLHFLWSTRLRVVLHFLIEAVLVFFFGLISVPSITFQFFHSGFRSFHLSTLSKLYFKVGNIYVQWWLPLNSFLYNYFESCKVVSVNSIGPKSASSSHKRYLSSCSVSLCKGYSSYWQRGYASPIFYISLYLF